MMGETSSIQNPHVALLHAHDIIVGNIHSFGSELDNDQARDFERSICEDVTLGHSDEQDLFLAENNDHKVAIEHGSGLGSEDEDPSLGDRSNNDENKFSQIDETKSVPGENEDGCSNLDDRALENSDQQLEVIPLQHDLDLADSHELAVVENHVLDENLELVLNQNHEMGVLADPDMSFQYPHLLVTAPILQSRSEYVAPTHDLTVGQEFPDVQSCRRAMRDIAIALHFEIQTVKSDKTRFTVKCASDGCPWRVHAAKLPGVPTFSIRTIHKEHTCGGIGHLGHQQASVQWVASSVEQRLRENPHYKPKEILEEIHRVHGITLSYKQAWRGKERIMASLKGSFEDDFRLIPQYCEQIKRTNPGSIASVYVNPVDSSFQRFFVSYQASIFGFLNGCRPIIGLDRTVLKSKYLGTMLFSTGFDGDGVFFPLAFGVVDEENDGNWMWFLSELHNLLEVNTENMPRLTILSDRQKSVTDAVATNFPTAFHGFCLRHLTESFQREFNNPVLVNLLWQAANALTPQDYETKIVEMESISQEAAYWIRRVSPCLWATSFFEGTRFGHLTANIAESLNAWILEVSGLPIIQMLECIRRQLMMWFNERREASLEWTSVLVPSAERLVTEAIERARTYRVLRAAEAEFEVISHEGSHVVDIRNRSCTCRGWQLHGLPCAHGVSALLSCRQNVHRFTESCFTVAAYRKTYSQTLHPLPDRSLWKEVSVSVAVGDDNNNRVEGSSSLDVISSYQNGMEIVVNPPKCFRAPTQTRKRRARAEDRGGHVKRVVHCSRCNQTGHFRTTCAAPI